MKIVDGLKNLLLDLTIGRADKVATVKSWDGSASNYPSPDSYCAACLLDLNPVGEAKKKSLCMLPVREPGSKQMTDKGLFAAVGGRGISAVKKPTEVDQATWDKAINKAARKIEGMYHIMQKPVPNTIKDLVGISRSVSVESLMQQLQCSMYEDMGMHGSMAKEYGYLSTVYIDNGYLSTVYIDNGELYALFVKEGLYSRSHLTIDPTTDVVTLDPLEPVTQTFTPVQRSNISVTREANGVIRLFMVAGTALINRVNQIDSTTLYDDFIQRANDYAYYPTFDFYHLGQDYPTFEFGKTDWLGRDGVCYLASGTLDPNHWLTEPIARALETDPDQWGASIEYYPVVDSVEFIEVDKLEIPVFKQGLNVRISILPEANAAAWFTTVSREKKEMSKQQEEALKKLLGEAEYTKRMASIATVNETVDRQKLVFRSTDQAGDQVVEPAATPVVVTPETPPTVPTISNNLLEVDETMLGALTDKVTQTEAYMAPLTTLTQGLADVQKTLDSLNAMMNTLQSGLTSSVGRMNKRLDQLEASDQDQSRLLKVDAPRKANDQKLRMVYRPREIVQRETEYVEPSFAEIAQKTLDERYPKIGI